MGKLKIHLAVMLIRGEITFNQTLCGIYNRGNNERTVNESEVTCKKCKVYIEDTTHWRHRKFLTKRIKSNAKAKNVTGRQD